VFTHYFYTQATSIPKQTVTNLAAAVWVENACILFILNAVTKWHTLFHNAYVYTRIISTIPTGLRQSFLISILNYRNWSLSRSGCFTLPVHTAVPTGQGGETLNGEVGNKRVTSKRDPGRTRYWNERQVFPAVDSRRQ
jgi:hypothetical protein